MRRLWAGLHPFTGRSIGDARPAPVEAFHLRHLDKQAVQLWADALADTMGVERVAGTIPLVEGQLPPRSAKALGLANVPSGEEADCAEGEAAPAAGGEGFADQ